MDLDDLDLDELLAGVAPGDLREDSLKMAMDSLREPSAKDPLRSAESMIFDLGIRTLTLSSDLFDRLVVRHVYKPTTGALGLTSQDQQLYGLGLVEIVDKYGDTYYLTGEPQTTTMTSCEVLLTNLGLVVLKLAGPAAIANSLIRQSFFISLEKLMKQFKREWLSEFLSHETLRVRTLATKRLDQLDKED